MIPINEDSKNTLATESQEVKEFCAQLEDIYHEYFPKSYVKTSIIGYDENSIGISIALGDSPKGDVLDAYIVIHNEDLKPFLVVLDDPLIMRFSRVFLNYNAREFYDRTPKAIHGDRNTILREWEHFCSKLYKDLRKFYRKGLLWDVALSDDVEDRL